MPQPPQIRTQDRQTYPFVTIPKLFLTRFQPSPNAVAAYLVIKQCASWQTGASQHTSLPRMAAMVGVSVNTFKKGVEELRKKGAVRVHYRWQEGKRVALPNLYEVLDLQPREDEA